MKELKFLFLFSISQLQILHTTIYIHLTKELQKCPPKISGAKCDKFCRFLVGLPMRYCSSTGKQNKHIWTSLLKLDDYIWVHIFPIYSFYNPTIHKWWCSYKWQISKQYFSSLMGCLNKQTSPYILKKIRSSKNDTFFISLCGSSIVIHKKWASIKHFPLPLSGAQR